VSALSKHRRQQEKFARANLRTGIPHLILGTLALGRSEEAVVALQQHPDPGEEVVKLSVVCTAIAIKLLLKRLKSVKVRMTTLRPFAYKSANRLNHYVKYII
jgi:hypothetical protein